VSWYLDKNGVRLDDMTNILTRDARTGALARRERPVRPGLVLAVVLIGQFMAVLDASIVNVAAPSIHASLRASGAGLQLVVAGYTITYAVLLVTGARLGDILGHQGRIVMLEYLTNPFGARAGDQIPTNEQISFSDPANSFDAFGGGSPYTIGIQQQVFVQEFPNGYGAWGSISAGELFLVKHQGGGVLVTGDIASPTVTRLPGVVSTGGMTCRAASTPLGLVYYARFSGLYIWRGADTSDKISQNLEDDFIFYTSGPDKFVNTAVQIQEWADWVVTTNGFLYDTISGGWWRLDNPATYIPQWFGRGFFATDLYAIPCRLNNTTKTGAVRKYSRGTPTHTYSWQSQPIPRYINRLAESREYVLVAEGAGTVVVSATNIDGTTDPQTFTLPAIAASQQVRLRLPCAVRGYDVTVKIVATGTGGSGAAPIVHSVDVGAHQGQEVIER